MNFSSLKDFFEKFKRLIVYPQYSMFLIEIFYCLCLCYFTLFRTKSHLVKLVAILIIFIVFILFYRQFNCRREINYGTFRDQLNDTRKQGEEIKKTNSILRISFLIILNIFLYGFLFGSVNKNPWMFRHCTHKMRHKKTLLLKSGKLETGVFCYGQKSIFSRN